jgi:hypothetical protein
MCYQVNAYMLYGPSPSFFAFAVAVGRNTWTKHWPSGVATGLWGTGVPDVHKLAVCLATGVGSKGHT